MTCVPGLSYSLAQMRPLSSGKGKEENQVVGELRPKLVNLLTLLGKIWFFPVLELSAPCRYTRRRRRKGRMFCP